MKNVLTLFLITAAFSVEAKRVKFSVDMTGQTINANGVHVAGDFQALAGLGADWDPATAAMSQEGNTNIYSIVVNIPAFRKYEYRIINGIETYESEFVPDESRVGYDMVDNRWLYVDSLANDTTFTGNILFGGNAPAGKFLVRYKVDMRVAGGISSNGVHVGTSYQAAQYSPLARRLYSFEYGRFEIIDFLAAGTYSYLFINGNTSGNAEVVQGVCATSGKRTVNVTADVVLQEVCYSTCTACVGVGISDNENDIGVTVYPNPVRSVLNILSRNGKVTDVKVTSLAGEQILQAGADCAALDVSTLPAGMYFLTVTLSDGSVNLKKIAVAQ